MNIKEIEEILAYYETTYEFCLSMRRIEAYQTRIRQALTEDNDAVKRAILYFTYAEGQFKNDQMEEAYPNWQQALHYAEEAGLTAYVAKCRSHLAIYWYVHGEGDKERLFFGQARRTLGRLHLYDALAAHYVDMLCYRRYDPDTTGTMEYLQRAAHYAGNADSSMSPRLYLHIGYIYKVIFSDFILGSQYLTMAAEAARKYKRWEEEAMALHILADGYIQIEHYTEARFIYQQIQSDNHYADITPRLRGRILQNLILCDFQAGELAEAEARIDEMEALRNHMWEEVREQAGAVVDRLRASLYLKQGIRLEEAERLLRAAEEIYLRYGRRFYVEQFDYRLYMQLGELEFIKGDLAQAEKCYHRAEAAAVRYDLHAQRRVLARLVKLYQTMGDYRRAYDYCLREDEAMDTIAAENMAARYETLCRAFFRTLQDNEIQELNQKHEELRRDIDTDALTQVYNKKYYLSYLQRLRQGEGGRLRRLTVLMIDIDNFKGYNDYYGHQQGDDCLRKVAQAIADSAAPYNGKVMRYGGEEFVVMLENQGLTEGTELAKALHDRLEAIHLPHAPEVRADHVTVSVGIAEERRNIAEQIDELLERSDEALYLAKRAGGNQAACDMAVREQRKSS